MPNTVNVLTGGFGVTGDGSHNDANGFIAAAAAVSASGGVLYVPPPPVAYRIAPSGVNPPDLVLVGINIVKNNLRIVGDGWASFLKNDGCSVPILITGNNCSIEGIRCDLNVTASFYDALLMAGDNCKVQGCRIENSAQIGRSNPRTVGSMSGRGLTNFQFLDNETYNLMFGIGWSGVQGCKIQRNRFYACQEMGMSLVTGASVTYSDIIITDNYIEDPTNCGIYIGLDGYPVTVTYKNVTIANNQIKAIGPWSVGGIVVRTTSTMRNVRITDNIIDGNGQGLYGVAILEGNPGDDAQDIAIVDNTISNAAVHGVYMRAFGKRPCRVANNHIRSCQYGIDFEPGISGYDNSAHDVDIEYNLVEGCSNSGMYMKVYNGNSFKGRFTGNKIFNNGGKGIELATGGNGTIELAMKDNVIGDDQISRTQHTGVDWTGCLTSPVISIINNDLSTSLVTYNPANIQTWTATEDTDQPPAPPPTRSFGVP